jgi:hypothetical protein
MVHVMAGNEIWLSGEQRETLEKFVRTGVHGAMEIRRARTILALDRTGKKDHLRVGRVCEAVGLSRQGLNVIRKEFLNSSSIQDFLTRKKRATPPVPAKVTGEVEAQIIAIACSAPPEGSTHWTVRMIAARTVELEIAGGLGKTTVGKVLKKRNISLI